MDRYKIDSHKLIYHVSRLNDWMEGKTIYPIYMEISPSGACNHRCVYCGLDFMEYQTRYLDSGILKERLSELGMLGLKSIMYAGEGEPFLHQHMAEIVAHTKKSGIDTAVITNAVLFSKDIAERTIGNMKWIKVSINGGGRDTYAKIHRCSPDDFNKVIKNMTYAATLKRKMRYSCTLGMQILLLPENAGEIVRLAELAKDIGMSYLVIKPYSQHPQSKTTMFNSIKYHDYEYLADELEKFNTDDFSVIFRIRAMKKWDDNKRNYRSCLALPFWSYIDAGGNVWGCSVYLRNEQFLYGNIYKQLFQDIWEGEKRKKSLDWFKKDFNVSECRTNCRMDEINKYLWELKNLPEHVNFI